MAPQGREPEAEEEVEQPVAAEPEGEVEQPVAAEPEAEGPEDGLPKTRAELQHMMDQVVGKAQSSWQTKLQRAAQLEERAKVLEEQLDKVRYNDSKPTEDALPTDFEVLPEGVRAMMLREKKAREELLQRDTQREQELGQMRKSLMADRIDAVVNDMREDTDSYPGFAEVLPQIEQMAQDDPALLRAVQQNPRRYLRMAYRDLTAEKAPVLARRELEKKLELNRKATTTKPAVRDMKVAKKFASVQEAIDAAMAEAPMEEEE